MSTFGSLWSSVTKMAEQVVENVQPMADRVKAQAASIDTSKVFEKVGSSASEAFERAKRQAAPQLAQAKETAFNLANQQAKSLSMVNAKTLLNSRASYGVPLDALAFRDDASGATLKAPKVPPVLDRLVSFLEARGAAADPRLFLAPVNQAVLRAMVKALDADAAAAAAVPADADPRAVAAALREWLLQLPEPLLTWDRYDAILSAGLDGGGGRRADGVGEAAALREAVAGVPRQNWLAARRCLGFLSRAFQACADAGAMSLSLGPAMLRPRRRDGVTPLRALAEDLPAICDATESLLRHAEEVFQGPPPGDDAPPRSAPAPDDADAGTDAL